MPINWRGVLVSGTCGGLVLLNGMHGGHECAHGHHELWCKQMPVHHRDMPELHFRSTPPSTGQQQVQLDTGSTSGST
jgi:hypothetical protein